MSSILRFTPNGYKGLLQGIVGKQSTSVLYNCYIGLSKTIPNDNPASDPPFNFTQPSTSDGYARAILGLTNSGETQKMTIPVNNSTTNNQIIFFPQCTSTAWGTICAFGLFSSLSGGISTNLMAWGLLQQSGGSYPSVGVGEVPLFTVNNFTISLSTT